jgi:hypothetical protein
MSIKKFQSRIVDVYQIIPIKDYLIHFGCMGLKEKVELGLGLGLYFCEKRF